MSSAGVLPALDNIIRDTQHFIQDNNVLQPRLSTRHPSGMPPLCLPDPPSLYPALIAIGADERVSNEMNRAYNARALELRTYYEKSINNAFAALNDLSFPRDSEKRILDTFASLYLTKVKTWIEDGVTAFQSSRKSIKQPVNNNEAFANSRRTFNPNYIPLLEHFFVENPFPTQADKMHLAKKSGMTYRQIHVWFQNRRNRARKPNASRRDKATCGARVRPRSSSRMQIGHLAVRSQKTPRAASKPYYLNHTNTHVPQVPSPQTALHDMTCQANKSNALDTYTAPPHAFPSPYLPAYPRGPFSFESRQFLSRPQQEMGSDCVTSLQPPETDVNELADRFSLLNVRDNCLKRSQGNCSATEDSLAATCSITITPSPAPHPALIKPAKIVRSLSHISPFPVTRASHPISAVFTESTVPSTLSSLPQENDGHFGRKVSPLPIRYPPRSTLSCRDETLPTSDVQSSATSPCSSVRSLSEFSEFEQIPPSVSGPDLPLPPQP